jgi:hypothetical protein
VTNRHRTFEASPVLGVFTPAVAAVAPQSEELKAAYARIAQLEQALIVCSEYFEKDADFIVCDVRPGMGAEDIPNAEMEMLLSIEAVL